MTLTPDTLFVILDASWRISLVFTVAWGAARLLGRRPAALRHAVWATALLAALVVPMLGGVLPSWRVPVLPAPAALAIVPSSPNVSPSRPKPRPVAPSALEARAFPPGDADQSLLTGSGEIPAVEAIPARSTADWLGLLWASVAAMILGRYCASVASIRWLTRNADPVADSRWRDASDVASAELGLADSPALLSSHHVAVPFTSGVLHPVVVIPSSALSTWTDERIRVVLLHELAHVRRRDCLVQAMSQVACAAYWFNPLTWAAARRLRAERERACDDLVLDAGMRGADYAQHLLDIARSVTSRRSLSAAALAMARPSELEGRLLAILDGHRARRVVGGRVSWRLAAALVAVVVPVASVQPVAREVSVVADHAGAIAGQSSPAPTPAPTPAASVAVAVSVHPLTPAESAQISAVASRAVGSLVAQTGEVASAGVSAVASGAAEGVSESLRELGFAQSNAPSAPNAKSPRAKAQVRPVSPAVIAGLTEAMKDPDADVRKQAMQALTRLGAPLAYDTLVVALKDEDSDMRRQAAFSLGQLRDARAIAPLSAALTDTDEDVRQQALFALSQIGDRSALPAFIQALRDSSEDVREQALFALSQVGDSEAVPAILPLLSGDESEDVRQQAAFALSQIGDQSAVAALTAALKDPSPDVRRQAIFALSQIADGDRDPRHRGRSMKTPGAAPTPAPAPVPLPPPAPPPPR